MSDEKADKYNDIEIDEGRLYPSHVTEMTRIAQEKLGLTADGFCGPKTRAALEAVRKDRVAQPAPFPALPALTVDPLGWLVGDGVVIKKAHESWYPVAKAVAARARAANTRNPLAIVAHYTATGTNVIGDEEDVVKVGTARSMANRRAVQMNTPSIPGPDDRVASWHVTIETNGEIWQMIPFLSGGWHVQQSRPEIPGAGLASLVAVGVELVGWGKVFTVEQVNAAARLWRALVQAYGIPRERAMVTHQELDPDRRNDPGPVWMSEHAPRVLAYAFAK